MKRPRKKFWFRTDTLQTIRWVMVLMFCSAMCGFSFNAGYWKPLYTVRYDANGATTGTPPDNQVDANGATVTVAANPGILSRTGHTLTGWNTAANGSGSNYILGSGSFTLGNADVTLYAQWTINSYNVSYNANSATSGTVPAGGSYVFNSTVTVASNSGSLSRTGYTFAGWNTASNGSGSSYTAGTGTFVMGAANVVLYAKWTVNTYSVSYNANGATSGTAPASANYNFGSTVTLAGNTGSLARTGYTFNGWNTASNGTGSNYTAGSGSFTMGASNLTLYARWTIVCGSGGAAYNGLCWYKSTAGTTCSSFCSSRGGVNAQTCTFAAASMANCQAIVTAIGHAIYASDTVGGPNTGCSLRDSGLYGWYIRMSVGSCSTSAVGDQWSHQLCACAR